MGAVGDPADLIVRKSMTKQGAAVRSAAPFTFSAQLFRLRRRARAAFKRYAQLNE
jgi:hypothetical protein